MKQDKLLGRPLEVRFSPQDGEQREHHLAPVTNGSLHARKHKENVSEAGPANAL